MQGVNICRVYWAALWRMGWRDIDGALMRTEKSIRVVEIVAKESQVEVGNTVRWYPGPDSVTVELCVGQGRAPEPGPWG